VGNRDPVSRTNFNKIHASRFESVIFGETSGKRNFHDQTQIIHAYLMKYITRHMHSGIHESCFFLSNFHASRINPLPPSSQDNLKAALFETNKNIAGLIQMF